MKAYFWSILLLYFHWQASQVSLYGANCGQNLSRVLAERLVYRFSHKLEEGSRNCAWKCVKNLMCGTFSHVNGSCQQYDKDGNALMARFQDRCKVDEGCNYKHGHCLLGFCSCEVGYSFDFEKNICVKECASYGSDFSIYKHHGTKGCNIKALTVPNVDGCTQACRDDKTFRCINADFSELSHYCHLCDTTWFDIPPAKREREVRNWLFIYRHCQWSSDPNTSSV